MKVYIVSEGEYSDWRIVRVFSNRKMAEQYASIMSANNGNVNDGVDEYDVDSPKTINHRQHITAALYVDARKPLTDVATRFSFQLLDSTSLDFYEKNETKYFWSKASHYLSPYREIYIERALDKVIEPCFRWYESSRENPPREEYPEEYTLIDKYKKVCEDIMAEINSLIEVEGWTDEMIAEKYKKWEEA